MDFFDNLSAHGITIAILQVAILGGIAVFILGMFWKYIVAGVGILFCVVVFAMPNKAKTIEVVSPAVVPTLTQPMQPEVKTIVPDEEVVEVIPDQSEKGMFMTDCQKYGGYTASQCTALWNDRENDKVRYRNATNKMFMLKAKYRYNI